MNIINLKMLITIHKIMDCTYYIKSQYENHGKYNGMKNTDEKEKEGCRKCKSDEGRIETDMALSEFPAFVDNNARQSSSHVRMCYVKKTRCLYRIVQSNCWNYFYRKTKVIAV